jgi:hypothetical protein
LIDSMKAAAALIPIYSLLAWVCIAVARSMAITNECEKMIGN